MISVFNYEDYKEAVLNWIEELPKQGRGQTGKIAEVLNVNSSFISQVLKGDKEFNLEQANILAEYMGLDELEADYFLLLVQLKRCGHYKLKERLNRKLKKIKDEAKNLSNRVNKNKKLTKEQSAIFYSNWIYSAVRMSCDLPTVNNLTDLIELFPKDPSQIKNVYKFLIETGLIIEEKDELRIGPSYTHLPASSPLASLHHLNWRRRASERYGSITEKEVVYTSLFSLSYEDAEKIRELQTQHIKKILEIVKNSPPETLMTYCCDWTKILND